MKKRVYLLSIVTISLGLINCGGGSSNPNTPTNTNNNTDSEINNQQDTYGCTYTTLSFYTGTLCLFTC